MPGTVTTSFGTLSDRSLAVAYRVGLILLVDPESDVLAGPVGQAVAHLVQPVADRGALDARLVEISDELTRRGHVECFECTGFLGEHVPGECSQAV
ncbi:hypothetical protein AB0B89_35810 [Sphaerisporangium sp. NPDC049002]|uniref:hypothetical protein n=1 Tax=Sphaerisporangium sp. NPDC049002 TaxID=3155392 RepID=UPI0033C52924